jgi:hypothetical protein
MLGWPSTKASGRGGWVEPVKRPSQACRLLLWLLGGLLDLRIAGRGPCAPALGAGLEGTQRVSARSLASPQPDQKLRKPAAGPARRQPPGRPGTSASRARSSMTRASCGLVRNPTCSGTRAAPPRAGSLVHERGRYSSRVDERPPPSAGVGQEHPQLAVVDLAGRARVLALHPHRRDALLDEPGLVHHQHRGSPRSSTT